jgi:hypothetical protein
VDADNRPVLVIYAVWHPSSNEGERLAEHLFRSLCADPSYPTRRGLGVPVRFRTSTSPSEVPAPIPPDGADRTVVVVLADPHLLVAGAWRRYVTALTERTDIDLVIPVALTPVEHLPAELAALRTVVLPEDAAHDDRSTELLNQVMHQAALLLDTASTSVKVFISYARRDGLPIAGTVRRYLHEVAGLDDFFDAADIPSGSRLAEEITSAVGTVPALLAIQTDSYASREWCRLEVLQAKRRQVPIVVLTAVESGEHRAFPYLGNVPVIRWNGEGSLPVVVTALLREVLRTRYFPKRVQALCRLYGLDPNHQVFAYPPELLTVLTHRHDATNVGRSVGHYLYPDPPLGTQELELIHLMDPSLRPITPTTLGAS